MPISFRCAKCNQLLRVPDDAAEKQAKCPSCSEVVTVPTESTEPTAPTPPPPGSPSDPPSASDAFRDPAGPNPYSSPTSDTSQQDVFSYEGPLTHQVIDVNDVMNTTWAIFKQNMGPLVLGFLILFGVSMAMGAVFQVVSMLLFGQAGGGPPGMPGQPGFPAGQGQQMPAALIAYSFLTNIISFVVQTFLSIGIARMYLTAARGGKPELGLIGSGFDKLVPILISSFLFTLIYVAGLAFCIIPGIFLGCALWMFFYLVLDRDAGVTDSLSQAWEFSKGNRMNAFLLGLIQFGLGILGVLMLCVGLLFTSPLAGLMWAVAYLKITGQPVAQPEA